MFLQRGTLLAAGCMLPVEAVAAAATQAPTPPRKSIYESIGVRPLINARGTVTVVGATRVLPEVKTAMDLAPRASTCRSTN